MAKTKKIYYPPQFRLVELRQNFFLLAGSGEGNGEMDPNPNVPI